MRRRALLAALAAAAGPASTVPAGVALAGELPLAARPISRLDLPWWRARHAAKLADKAARPIRLVFLGDSITQQYEHDGPTPMQNCRAVWDRYYGNRDALNLGFSGDATCHLLWRIENGEIAGIAPRAAVVLIGTNNFGRLDWSAQDTIAGIRAVVAATRARLPRTSLLLLGVLPADRGPAVMRKMQQTNETLAATYGQASGVTYMDVGGLFLHDGSIDRSQFIDPTLPKPAPALHPTAAAQARMAAAIEPTLAAMLGDRDHRPA